MNSIVLSIGSNSVDREWQISNCVEWLKKLIHKMEQSSVYNSEAANGVDADYLNTVIKGYCNEDYESISASLKQYETVCGRTPMSKTEGIIPLDIDIVIWDDEIVRARDFAQPYFQKGWNEIKY